MTQPADTPVSTTPPSEGVETSDEQIRQLAEERLAANYTYRNGVDPLARAVLRLLDERDRMLAVTNRARHVCNIYESNSMCAHCRTHEDHIEALGTALANYDKEAK